MSPATESGVPRASPIRRIPVILLTGFLGSGKTTLLRKLLREPGWSDAAVLINELGAVGLDHQLAWGASASMLVLENGCICCSARDDLVNTLEELFWNRLHKKIPRFDRVIIETTGLADPGPIITELFSHPLIAERYRLESVVCTVDGMLGLQQLESHPESLAQAASADIILLTKTDIAALADVRLLESRMREVNPLATVHAGGALDAAFMCGALAPDEAEHRVRLPANVNAPSADPAQPDSGQRYLFHRRVRATVIRFDHPWELATFTHAVQTATERYGERVLRIKGVIEVAGRSGQVVVQVVGRMIFPFEDIVLPSPAEAQNFIVCITLGVADADMRHCFVQRQRPPAVRADD